MPKRFIREHANEKNQVRALIQNHYIGGKVLSLSAGNFIFEKGLFDKYGNDLSIDCVEYDKDVYEEGLPIYKELKKTYPNLRYKFENIFNINASEYDFIFLDLCSNFVPITVLKVIGFLQGFNGTIFITVLKGREPIANILHLFDINRKLELKKQFQKYRSKVIPQMFYNYLRLVEFLPEIHYSNKSAKKKSESANPMLVYSFRSENLLK